MGGMESLLETKKKSRNVVEEGVCAAAGGSSLLIRSLGRVARCDWLMEGRLGRGSPPFAGLHDVT
ncbi:uncharacterized protein N7473_008416 [Penicillium subrubescens]|jgi:coenzyme F420-reducing hydrogenase gamma subunit|uniref:uncharacterized protein n=1 Tax=Penicillium subrubescens TaxID=1316194 RepID=UPI002545A72E|nr:uncharacterized protein N7473_008416 [Penicillium subrubescens]KAJ5892188.1 hypothetical protein N7473_008416 [Penicillium subrubescens]